MPLRRSSTRRLSDMHGDRGFNSPICGERQTIDLLLLRLDVIEAGRQLLFDAIQFERVTKFDHLAGCARHHGSMLVLMGGLPPLKMGSLCLLELTAKAPEPMPCGPRLAEGAWHRAGPSGGAGMIGLSGGCWPKTGEASSKVASARDIGNAFTSPPCRSDDEPVQGCTGLSMRLSPVGGQ